MTPRITIQTEPLAVNAKDAAAMIGVSESTFRRLVADGVAPQPRRLGTRCVWTVQALRAWLSDTGVRYE